MLFNQNQPTTLIVVYKNEMFANQLKKLIETNDDTEGKVVGIQDGSVDVVAWDEKTWAAQKKAGNITSKVLFLGDIKGTEKLVPVIDEKFNKHGVHFGWAGKQAIVYTDDSLFKDRSLYPAFTEELNEMAIPDSFKHIEEETLPAEEPGAEEKPELAEPVMAEETEEDTPVAKGFKALLKAKKVLSEKLDEAGESIKKISSDVAEKAEDIKERSFIKKQQMLYGVISFYYDGLNSFINS